MVEPRVRIKKTKSRKAGINSKVPSHWMVGEKKGSHAVRRVMERRVRRGIAQVLRGKKKIQKEPGL